MSIAKEIREAKEQAEKWARYSHTATCARKHETLHAMVQAACWRARVKKLKKKVGTK